MRGEGCQLLLVAFWDAASTGFQSPNERWVEAGILAGLAHHAAGRLHQAARCPDRHRANHAMDWAAGGPSILQPLQHQHHGPLGRHTPRSRGGKNRAGPSGERLAASQALKGGQIERPLSGGAQHGVARLLAEHVGRRGNRREAGAIPCIERHSTPHEIERFGESARERAAGEATRLIDQRRQPLEHPGLVGLDDTVDIPRRDAPPPQRIAQENASLRQAQPHLELIVERAAKHRSHDHSSAQAVESRLGDPGLRQSCIGRLQQHELQRVGGGDLLGGHLVAPPIVLKVADESPQAGRGAPRPRSRGVERLLQIPAVCGNRPQSRPALFKQFVEGLERERSGQDAAHAHDGNRLGLGIAGWRGRRSDRGTRSRHMLRQRHMDIEPADAEGIHRRAARPAIRLGWPGNGF